VDLSIVIVNWNTRDELRACLRSLRATTAEVIVVDNASADGSAAMVRAEFPEALLIANGENRGYAVANNQGIDRAGGAFVMLLNPDTEVPGPAPTAMLEFLRDHPKAGAVAPRLVHPDGRVQESVRGWPTPAGLIEEATGLQIGDCRLQIGGSDKLLSAIDPLQSRYRVSVAGLTEPAVVPQPMTSCLVVRRAALEQVGLLDERFPIFFNDVDFCFRLWAVGWEIWYLPAVRVLHHGGASTRQVRPRMIRESHRSLIAFYAKHYRGRLPALVYAATVAAIRLVGTVRWLWALGSGLWARAAGSRHA
jgi:GT2 family glycosyltransferase